jgi:excisionase family DNA binding protein
MAVPGSSGQYQAASGSASQFEASENSTAEMSKKSKMSSNIRLKKICQHCGQSFIAKTTVTKFCSDDCAKRNYKKRQKDQKVTKAILETNNQLQGQPAPTKSKGQAIPPLERLNRDWINIRDVSELLGIAERTMFRLIKEPTFPKLKIGRKLLFNKQQVMEYFISKSEGYEGEA